MLSSTEPPSRPTQPQRPSSNNLSSSASLSDSLKDETPPLWTPSGDGMWYLRKSRRSHPAGVPPVVVSGNQADGSDGSRTLHILGTDAKARLLACELEPFYDSVHLLKPTRRQVLEFEFRSKDGSSGSGETSGEAPGRRPSSPQTHISNLITTGSAVHAVANMEQLKHRIDDKTAVCLMHDGLGVAEELNDKVFNGDDAPKPEYVLGHLPSNKLLRERYTAPFNRTKSSGVNARPVHASTSLKTCLLTPFHKWLHLKFQAMIFAAVVDPVCVVVGCRYDEITQIKWGMTLMMMLLDEIQQVVAALPEVQSSPLIQSMVKRDALRKVCLGKLRSMKPGPSRMAFRLDNGYEPEIESFNGYFIRRGRQLGVACPQNEMVVAMIKAKHGKRLKELDEQIPFEITSRPHRNAY
ncbi:unnamed protein product [Parascedosporium putredinis]|uniref:2-dehydropantoate 2-reductase n=1 Tax=Parascedosporium putredinis TaxID=1442378 RepID=A0A9P1GUU3_9PEZI|nr:unnamed protein product [Parascedosporium putredinis]CAI7988054.1 unnamed protein product [Parascedosporium putredinis]